METTHGFRIAKVMQGKLRADFETTRREYLRILGQIKALYGAKPEKITDGKWYWWIADSDRNRSVLTNLGFTIEDPFDKDIELPGTSGLLRNYQRTGVRFMDRTNGSMILGDDMGLGKTCQSLSYVAMTNRYPLLIVCPASLKLNWEREYDMWCFGREPVEILSGRKPHLIGAKVAIINYDILSYWKTVIMRWNPKQAIFDEVQYIKRTNNSVAARTKAAIQISRGRSTIFLSGTPIKSRPYEFFNLLNLLDPEKFPSAHQFGARFCAPTRNHFSGYLEYKGATNLAELNALLKPLMLRRRKEDVLKELPPKQRIVVPLPVEFKYMKEYRDLESAIRNNKATGREALQVRNKVEALKQLAVKMKMKSAIDWIKDYLEDAEKLVVFTTHTAPLDQFMEVFGDIAVKVNGKVTGDKRQAAVDKFQNDPSCRLFFGNLQAAGVGLTLTAANATAHMEFGWTPADHTQGEDRVHRIGQKADSVFAYYMVASGTIDEWLMEILDDKQKVVDAVLDGVDTEESMMLTALMQKFQNTRMIK